VYKKPSAIHRERERERERIIKGGEEETE